jgi:deoxyribodipyrimidine photo-lyase
LLTEQQQQQQQLQQQDSSDVVDWGATIRSTWDISERGALQLLSTFLTSSTGLSAYESARSFADGRSVSKLSPYLHFGQLSARLMWQRMKVAK